jgi:hypothetical protein
MAFTRPVLGSTVASAISKGAWVPFRASLTAASALACRAGSIDVSTRRPPEYTWSSP